MRQPPKALTQGENCKYSRALSSGLAWPEGAAIAQGPDGQQQPQPQPQKGLGLVLWCLLLPHLLGEGRPQMGLGISFLPPQLLPHLLNKGFRGGRRTLFCLNAIIKGLAKVLRACLMSCWPPDVALGPAPSQQQAPAGLPPRC